jgi:hypothetical protein
VKAPPKGNPGGGGHHRGIQLGKVHWPRRSRGKGAPLSPSI